MSFWDSLFGRDDAAAAAPPPVASTRVEHERPPESPVELGAVLTDLVRRVNASGGRMPEGGVPAVREVEDVLRPLLIYLQANPATEQEMIGVRAMILDYLPTTLDTFLKLPPAFVASHRNRAGQTPAEELLQQLDLLAEGAQESATAIYAGDAQRLTSQGRFLQNKFSRSELDL